MHLPLGCFVFFSVLRASVVKKYWDQIHHGGTENTENEKASIEGRYKMVDNDQMTNEKWQMENVQ
jgi:hypothetical protein